MEKASVDNLRYLDGEFGFLEKDLFGNLVMEFGSSWGHFSVLELGLDIVVGVLCSLTAHWHS